MGNNVSTNLNREREITRRQFQAALNQATSDVEMQKQAMSIFNTYAKKTAGGDDDVLDVNEQREAQEAFSALDADGKDEVSENEFNAQKNDNPDLKDTSYQVYSAFTQALGSIKPKEKSSVEVAKEKFSNDKDIKKAVASYLLGAELGDDVSDSMVNFSEGAYEIIMPEKDSTEPIKVKYGDKEFIVHIIDDKVSIDSTDGETTLQQAVLASNSTDVRHNYYNKDGIAGNSASVYKADTGKISNDSPRRQQVNPAQTFASMILNDNTNSTLKFKDELNAKDVIAVITEDSNSKEITLPQLVKYLKAVANEAKETVDNGITTGSRTAAKDVDFDIKDMANIGVVFKKYAGPDGKLNEVELQNLINDLSKGKKSMTELARNDKDNKYQYQAPTKPDDTLPEADPVTTTPQPQKGTKLQANRQRYIAGTNKSQKALYHYDKKTGTRTPVDKDGYERTGFNYAEFEDHGLFGAGKKDFVKIQGLPPAVRAEVFDGELQHNMIIKVKDSRGNEKYYRVNYDATKGTYTMGDEISENTAQSTKNPPKPEKPKAPPKDNKSGTDFPQWLNVTEAKEYGIGGGHKVNVGTLNDTSGNPVGLASNVSDFKKWGGFDGLHLKWQMESNNPLDGSKQKVVSSEIRDKKGKLIIRYDSATRKYYDGKGQEIKDYMVVLTNIYADKKYNDAVLVQNFATAQPGTLAPQNDGVDYSTWSLEQWANRAKGIDANDTEKVDQFVADFQSCHPGKSPEEVKYAYGLTPDDEVNKGHVHDFAFRLEKDFEGKVEIHLDPSDGSYRATIDGKITYSFGMSDKDDYNNRHVEIATFVRALEDKKLYPEQLDFYSLEFVNDVGAEVNYDFKSQLYTITVEDKSITVDNSADGFKRALNFVRFGSESNPEISEQGEVDYSTLTADGWHDLAKKATTREAQDALVDKYMQYNNIDPEDRDVIMQYLEFTTPGDPREGSADMFSLEDKYPGTQVTNNDEFGLLVIAPNGETLEVGNTPDEYARAEKFIRENPKK